MADMTATTLASVTPEVWSAKASETYRSNVVFVPLLDHTWEPELGVGRGDTVNIYGFTQNNAATNRGAGTGTFGTGAAITFDAVTEGQTQLVVNRLYLKAHRMPVEAKAQVIPGYLTKLLEGHGKAIALAIDSDIAADNTNGIDAFTQTVGTDNVDLTEDDLLEAETNLNLVNAPLDGRVGVVSPGSKQSLMKIEALRNQLYKDSIGNLDGGKGAGLLGPVLTFQLYMSNNLETGTIGKKNAFFQKEAIAFAEQISIQREHNTNIEDGLFVQDVSYTTCGFKIIKNTNGVEAAGK